MDFHIAASDGAGPDAWFAAPANYTDNPVRYTSTQPGAAGPSFHQAAPVDPTDVVPKGSAAIRRDQLAAVKAVRDSAKTLWEFSDGVSAYRVRIKMWELTPIGGGNYSLTWELMVVKKLK